jgi:hypothetical protein
MAYSSGFSGGFADSVSVSPILTDSVTVNDALSVTAQVSMLKSDIVGISDSVSITSFNNLIRSYNNCKVFIGS